MRKYVKKGAKKAWSAIKTATGNRYGRGRKQIISKGLPQMAKDINNLKALINVEKKYIDATYNQSFGQVFNNFAGTTILDITPVISQNVNYNGRTGQSVKLTGATIHMQLWQQTAGQNQCKIKFEIYYVKGTPEPTGTHFTQLYDPNPLLGIVDYNSDRQPNFYSEYKKIATKYCNFPAEQFAAQTNQSKNMKIHLKLNHHLRYDKNAIDLKNGQILIVAFAENGNNDPTNVSTLGVPTKAAATGYNWNMFTRFYYVDN
jgi:hypothetical protein